MRSGSTAPLTNAQRHMSAEIAVYCAWVNGAVLPERKKKSERKPLKTIDLYGYRDDDGFPGLRARAEGNVLCRELTVLPPNELTPAAYRAARQGTREAARLEARRVSTSRS